jgi:hypothetical protein
MEKIEIYLCIGVEVNKLNAIKFRFLILFEIYSTDINSLLSYSIDLSNSLISFFFSSRFKHSFNHTQQTPSKIRNIRCIYLICACKSYTALIFSNANVEKAVRHQQ